MNYGWLAGIFAIIAGVLILWLQLDLKLVVSIFLIIYGILALTGRR
jgi:hypothetical protein